jgi:hypothetical protein
MKKGKKIITNVSERGFFFWCGEEHVQTLRSIVPLQFPLFFLPPLHFFRQKKFNHKPAVGVGLHFFLLYLICSHNTTMSMIFSLISFNSNKCAKARRK